MDVQTYLEQYGELLTSLDSTGLAVLQAELEARALVLCQGNERYAVLISHEMFVVLLTQRRASQH